MQKTKYLLSYLKTFFQKIYRGGGDNATQLTIFRWEMDVFFVVAVIQSYSGLKLCSPFKKNTDRKNLFLSVCHCLDPKTSLREMNDLYRHGGLIGYGDSHLDSVLRYSKVFCLHAVLHDAAGAVYTEKRKGPGCCYKIGRGPNSCLFGHITGLLFCVFLKFFVPSIQLLTIIP